MQQECLVREVAREVHRVRTEYPNTWHSYAFKRIEAWEVAAQRDTDPQMREIHLERASAWRKAVGQVAVRA